MLYSNFEASVVSPYVYHWGYRNQAANTAQCCRRSPERNAHEQRAVRVHHKRWGRGGSLCATVTVRPKRTKLYKYTTNSQKPTVQHTYQEKRALRNAGWDLQEYNNFGSCYTEFSVERTHSHMINPAWTGLSVSCYIKTCLVLYLYVTWYQVWNCRSTPWKRLNLFEDKTLGITLRFTVGVCTKRLFSILFTSSFSLLSLFRVYVCMYHDGYVPGLISLRSDTGWYTTAR